MISIVSRIRPVSISQTYTVVAVSLGRHRRILPFHQFCLYILMAGWGSRLSVNPLTSYYPGSKSIVREFKFLSKFLPGHILRQEFCFGCAPNKPRYYSEDTGRKVHVYTLRSVSSLYNVYLTACTLLL